MNLSFIAQAYQKTLHTLLPAATKTKEEIKQSLQNLSNDAAQAKASVKQLWDLEQRKDLNSWNTRVTGKMGPWDVPFLRATDFQSKNPALNSLDHQVNNLTGLLSGAVNSVTNAAGVCLLDLPAALEDESVRRGGPSINELMVVAQLTEGPGPVFKADDALAYGLGVLAKTSRWVRGAKVVSKEMEVGEKLLSEAIHSNQLPSLDKLSQAAAEMDRNGLTKAGRALQKHSDRVGSAFAKPSSKNFKNLNHEGQRVVDEILNNPLSKMKFGYSKTLGAKVIDIKTPENIGIRYDEQLNFIGVLEP